jgi:hypothetical protein
MNRQVFFAYYDLARKRGNSRLRSLLFATYWTRTWSTR